jgi:hypothetical protein
VKHTWKTFWCGFETGRPLPRQFEVTRTGYRRRHQSEACHLSHGSLAEGLSIRKQRGKIMSRPTQQANFNFKKAYDFADKAGAFYQVTHASGNEEMGNRNLASAVRELASGLQHLSDGLRATYLLLEEIKNGNQRR